MRCFIGLDFSKNCLDKINNLMLSLKKSGIKGNYTLKNNFHLTLLFLSELNEMEVEKVKKVLDNIKFNSFDIFVSEITKLKDIIILKVAESEELMKLQKELSSALEKEISIKIEAKYFPHITLVRKNSDNIFKKVEIKERVESIYLFSSQRILDKLTYLKEYERVCEDE